MKKRSRHSDLICIYLLRHLQLVGKENVVIWKKARWKEQIFFESSQLKKMFRSHIINYPKIYIITGYKIIQDRHVNTFETKPNVYLLWLYKL